MVAKLLKCRQQVIQSKNLSHELDKTIVCKRSDLDWENQYRTCLRIGSKQPVAIKHEVQQIF